MYLLIHIHPQCRNSCELHQQSNHKETSDTVSTGEAEQQLQVPASKTVTFAYIPISCCIMS